MKRLLLLATSAVAALSACNYNPLPSNDPDSGVSCQASTTPAGSGTTSGTQAFAVGSSYQSAGQYLGDAGVNGAQISLSLLKKSASCVALQDGGTGGDGFYATVVNWNSDRVTTGTYPASGEADGGPSFVGFGVVDGGLRVVAGGTVTLASVQPCAVSGSFAVQFATEDGGRDPLSGTFSSEYCRY